MLKRKDFVVYDDRRMVRELYCKVCGEQIAGMVPRPKGPGPEIGVLVEKFTRFPNFADAKFHFNDGSFHVTNGCQNCLRLGLTPAEMLELYRCDMEEMDMLAGVRRPLYVMEVDYTQQGIP